jgi:hypothetical protein
MAERKQRILSAMNTRKKRIRQLAREHREEAERTRGQILEPKAATGVDQEPVAAPR